MIKLSLLLYIFFHVFIRGFLSKLPLDDNQAEPELIKMQVCILIFLKFLLQGMTRDSKEGSHGIGSAVCVQRDR